jgi:hypothetical protein
MWMPCIDLSSPCSITAENGSVNGQLPPASLMRTPVSVATVGPSASASGECFMHGSALIEVPGTYKVPAACMHMHQPALGCHGIKQCTSKNIPVAFAFPLRRRLCVERWVQYCGCGRRALLATGGMGRLQRRLCPGEPPVSQPASQSAEY